MPTGYSNLGFDPNLPPEVSVEAQAIARRRQMAEALMSQGMTPVQSTNPRSPISITQGLAQMLAAYRGGQAMHDTEQAQASLGQKYQTGLADEVKRIAAMRQGQQIPPDPQEMEQASDQGTPMPRTASTGDPRAAIQAALISQYPQVRQMGVLDHKTYENEQTRANDREARLTERVMALDAAAANQSAAREDRQREAEQAATLRRDLAGMRQPPAPSFTEIVDPADPTRMLRVDGRLYKGGTLGASGVLGISGKEPTAAKKAEQVDNGRDAVDTQVAQLRDYYNQLAKSGGIADPAKGAMHNIVAGVASSGVGQAAGRMVGTKDQSIRNAIAQQRPLLLNAIKNATGMSAKQMDSNAELKLYLAAATDPTLDIKANLEALDNIERLFGRGAGKGKAATPATGAPKVMRFDAQGNPVP